MSDRMCLHCWPASRVFSVSLSIFGWRLIIDIVNSNNPQTERRKMFLFLDWSAIVGYLNQRILLQNHIKLSSVDKQLIYYSLAITYDILTMHSSTLIATMAVLAIIIPVYAVKPKDCVCGSGFTYEKHSMSMLSFFCHLVEIFASISTQYFNTTLLRIIRYRCCRFSVM